MVWRGRVDESLNGIIVSRRVSSRLRICFVLCEKLSVRENIFFIAREKIYIYISTSSISYLSTRRISIDKGGKVLIDPYLLLRPILSVESRILARANFHQRKHVYVYWNDEFQPVAIDRKFRGTYEP